MFGLPVPLPGMVPQHVLSSAQVSDARIARARPTPTADEERAAEEAALAAEAAETAAESAAAVVTAVLEVAAARQKMVTALRVAFADTSEDELAATTATASELHYPLEYPLEYSASAEGFAAADAAEEGLVEEGWEVRRRVLEVERSIAAHQSPVAPPSPPPLAPPPRNPERSTRSAAVLVERQKAATAAAEDGLAEAGQTAAVEVRVVEGREGELREIRVHLPNGFPGRLPVTSPAQIGASFPGRMPAGVDFDTSAAMALCGSILPPPRVGSQALFTHSTQAAALPLQFPPQPPPQPPPRRPSEEVRQEMRHRSIEEPSQPSEAEVAGGSPCDSGGGGGSDGEGSDLEPDELPSEWSTATPPSPPRLLRAGWAWRSTTPPPPPRARHAAASSGLDGHVEAVGESSSSAASSEQRPSVASTPGGDNQRRSVSSTPGGDNQRPSVGSTRETTPEAKAWAKLVSNGDDDLGRNGIAQTRSASTTPAPPLSAKVGLRRGSQNIPLPQGTAPSPLRGGTPFDAGELEDDEGNKENSGDATTPRAVCRGPDAPLQAPRCATPRVPCATPELTGRSSGAVVIDETMSSPSPTQSEVGPPLYPYPYTYP